MLLLYRYRLAIDYGTPRPYAQFGDNLAQSLDLSRQRGACRGRLFYHSGVLLSDLVHLIDGGVYLGKSDRLLFRRRRNSVQLSVDGNNLLLDNLESVTGFLHQLNAVLTSSTELRNRSLISLAA